MLRFGFLIFLTLLHATILFAGTIPEWFKHQNIEHQSYEIIGYGSGQSMDSAEADARKDIALSVSVQVSSELKLSSKVDQDKAIRNLQQDITESSNLVLSGVEKVKYEKIEGEYFVALKYINLPFASKVKLLADKNICQNSINQNSYIERTPIASKLNNQLGCTPKLNVFKNGKSWFAEIDGKPYYLSQNDFLKLFAEGGDAELSIIPSKKQLKSGELYHLITYIKAEGYFSLFEVTKTGGVSVMINNEYAQPGMELIYPNLDEYDGLEAFLPEGSDREVDLHLGVLCKQPIQNAVFENITTSTEKSDHGFGLLIETMKHCKIYSVTTEVRGQ